MKKVRLFIGILILQLCFTLCIGNIVVYGQTNDRAPKGLIIWGQDYSGMSRTQIFAQLKERMPNGLTYQGQEYPLNLDNSYEEIEEWLDQMFPGPTGFWLTDVLQNLVRPSVVDLPNDFGLNRDEIFAQLKALSEVINKPMIPATIQYANGRLVRTDGQIGKELDFEWTWQRIIDESGKKKIELVVNDIPARPGKADVEEVSYILGDYTTYFDRRDVSRTINLRLAAEALDNSLMAPGEVFSFNDSVGERTAAAGYLPAIIYVDNAPVKDNGGGICQDSSTLYQAVKMARLNIVERHTHSLPVSYVLKGQDATVAYGLLDFRFQNDTQGYLLVSARVGTNWLRIQLFGLADDEHPVPLRPDGYPSYPREWDIDPK